MANDETCLHVRHPRLCAISSDHDGAEGGVRKRVRSHPLLPVLLLSPVSARRPVSQFTCSLTPYDSLIRVLSDVVAVILHRQLTVYVRKPDFETVLSILLYCYHIGTVCLIGAFDHCDS